MKECERCFKYLPIESFCKNKNKVDGLNTWCRQCTREYKKKYYQDNKEKLLEKFKQKYIDNPQKYRNQEKERRSKNREIYNKRAIEYQKNNKDKVNARNRIWAKNKRLNDPEFRLRANLRRRLNKFLKGGVKTASAIRDLGCTVSELKMHLEAKFSDGMNWGNYGEHWHIDHIKPLSLFDLKNESQLKQACNYLNLQPMIASENIRKGGINRKEFKQ